MTTERSQSTQKAVQAGGQLNIFEKYLTLWVTLCIMGGVMLGRTFPGIAETLDAISLYQVSVLIAICLFFMMYPIMVKMLFSLYVTSRFSCSKCMSSSLFRCTLGQPPHSRRVRI